MTAATLVTPARRSPWRGGVPFEDMGAPGPSARLPLLSAVVPIDALDLVSGEVEHWLVRHLPSVEVRALGIRHVVSQYDLRVGRSILRCTRCGARAECPIPALDAANHWIPRLTPDQAAAYAAGAMDFLRMHEHCRAAPVVAGLALAAQLAGEAAER